VHSGQESPERPFAHPLLEENSLPIAAGQIASKTALVLLVSSRVLYGGSVVSVTASRWVNKLESASNDSTWSKSVTGLALRTSLALCSHELTDQVKGFSEGRAVPIVWVPGLSHIRRGRSAMKERFMSTLIAGVAVLAVLTAVSVVQAAVTGDSISVHFGADEPTGGTASELDPTQVAGVVPSANWNNADTKGGVQSALTRDTNGVATTTGATTLWEATNTWSSTGKGEENNNFDPATGDFVLMTGYLDQNTASPSPIFIQIRNLPPDIASGTYDVYIYVLGGHSNKGGEYTCNNAGPLYFVGGGDMDNGPFTGRKFVQAMGTDPSYGPDDFGNYIVFQGQTGSTVTITATNFFGNNPRAPINGVQIVVH